MKEMTELKMVYELVISRANPLDNPRYELLNQAQRKMKDAILNVIRQTNPNYPEMDYDDDVFKYIVEFNDEYCIDSFAKGISFALNFKEQAERFMNKKYDYKKNSLRFEKVSFFVPEIYTPFIDCYIFVFIWSKSEYRRLGR